MQFHPRSPVAVLASVVAFAATVAPTFANAQTIGCADGQREGFLTAPFIAGCSGAWSVRGLSAAAPASLTPGCGRAGGDDGPNPNGGTCSAADLCGEGWHVCSSAAEVAASSPTGTCSGAIADGSPSLFFATRETGNGTGLCTDTAGINNDLFGCGNLGAAPDAATCSPLDRFSNNLCQNLNGATNVPWDCRDGAAAGTQEAREVIKTDSSRGGVLCCPDEDFDNDGIPGRTEIAGANPTNPNDPDTDNDGVNDGVEDTNRNGALDAGESNPNNFDQCGDTDADTCDDCAVGTDNAGPLSDSVPGADGADADSDGRCDAGDGDRDNDGILNDADLEPTNPAVCVDIDGDFCDDCAIGVDGFGVLPDFSVSNDGPDPDGDGDCNTSDDDDDNDGVLDADDLDSANPDVCTDADGDFCDDCTVGSDNFGPLADNLVSNDGTDSDSDGVCDLGDAAVCGDSEFDPGEQCDDGGDTSGDGCSATCQIEEGWDCTGLPSTCTTECGDALVAGSEACDDGANVDGDGCSAACAIEEGWTCEGEPSLCDTTCGDGVAVGAEECDDNNLENGDGCSAVCELEDRDEDTIADPDDNCPDNANPDQADLEADGFGDACDDDIDGDGLTNEAEEDDHGTDPTNADSDGDGLGDGLEVDGDANTDPTEADSDGDGLCDGALAVAEVCAEGEDLDEDGAVDDGETDPANADTDGDGIDDGIETFGGAGTDPLDADSDDDRLCDGSETVAGTCEGGEDVDNDGLRDDDETDPADSDTDDGTALDGDEVLDNDTDPLDPADDILNPDRDGDGVDNDDEDANGTNPDSADTDEDGLCDGAVAVSDVCVGGEDLDGDGVLDDGETDPNNADTDGGSVSDGAEVLDQGTDPLDATDDVPPAEYEFAGGGTYGCAAAPGATPPWGAVIALGAMFAFRRRRASRAVKAAAVAVLAIAAPDAAVAQDGFDVQLLSPGVSRTTSYWSAPMARTLERGAYDVSLFVNYADSPLVLNDADGERVTEVVSGQLLANVMAAYGILDWLDVGVDIPLVLMQSGDPLPADAEGPSGIDDAGFGLGDMRLAARASILPSVAAGTSGPMLAGGVDLRLPTGNDEHYQGGELRVEPRVMFDWVFKGLTRVGVQAGYLVRPSRELDNVQVNDQLTLSAASAVSVGAQDRGWIIPEIRGGLGVLESGDAANNSALELLLGGRFDVTPQWMVEAGTGTGLVSGVGTPDWRLFAGVSFHTPDIEDTDGDGIADADDDCPTDPEDVDGFEDIEGCSDPDNDGDGVLDVNDGTAMACANDPEDADGFEDANGCPDPDNDRDGILDANDGSGACANQPEDVDGWQDADGCPDPDNDADGLLDAADGADGACMNDPEDIDGFEDEDGCPEEGEGLVTLTCEAIEISGQVLFETDSADIKMDDAETRALLEQVTSVLRTAAYIELLRVEGHTDDRGGDDYNLDLSHRRAESVYNYLVDNGIEPSRLEYQGFGETRPLDTNTTEAGQARNRRVDFIIVRQDERCAQ